MVRGVARGMACLSHILAIAPCATATMGSLGSAMACAHLLRLPLVQSRHAVGVAATQAAGLKAMFGCWPSPCMRDLAARRQACAPCSLVEKGFLSRPDILECEQGFVRVHGGDFHLERALATPRASASVEPIGIAGGAASNAHCYSKRICGSSMAAR